MIKKNIFLVNPLSGKSSEKEAFIEKLNQYKLQSGDNIDIYVTQPDGATINFVKNLCEKKPSDLIYNLYACGGDGTLNEVVNGAFDYDNVNIGVFPLGTGNDFIRNFDIPEEDFLNIEKQLNSQTFDIDVIGFKCDDNPNILYCVNIFNIGFDANVVYKASKLKKHKIIPNKLAYFAGVFQMLMSMKGANLSISLENHKIHDGATLLTTIGNGCFCGGGIKGIPHAVVSDDLLDVSIVKPISRIKFLKFFPHYVKGTHTSNPDVSSFLTYKTAESFEISALDEDLMFCVDGEICHAKKIKGFIPKKKISFLLPG